MTEITCPICGTPCNIFSANEGTQSYTPICKPDAHLADWYKAGQLSVKRKNQSGCICIIEDDDTITSVCGAHRQQLEDRQPDLTKLREAYKQISSQSYDFRVFYFNGAENLYRFVAHFKELRQAIKEVLGEK